MVFIRNIPKKTSQAPKYPGDVCTDPKATKPPIHTNHRLSQIKLPLPLSNTASNNPSKIVHIVSLNSSPTMQPTSSGNPIPSPNSLGSNPPENAPITKISKTLIPNNISKTNISRIIILPLINSPFTTTRLTVSPPMTITETAIIWKATFKTIPLRMLW